MARFGRLLMITTDPDISGIYYSKLERVAWAPKGMRDKSNFG